MHLCGRQSPIHVVPNLHLQSTHLSQWIETNSTGAHLELSPVLKGAAVLGRNRRGPVIGLCLASAPLAPVFFRSLGHIAVEHEHAPLHQMAAA